MRNLLIAFSLLFISFNLYGQEEAPEFEDAEALHSWLTDKVEHRFGMLTIPQQNTGFLYDRVLHPIANIQDFEGREENLINKNQWLQLYFELQQFANVKSHEMVSPDELEKFK